MTATVRLKRAILLAVLGTSLAATALALSPARDTQAKSPVVGLCMESTAPQAGSLESVNLNASLAISGGDAHLDWETPPANLACGTYSPGFE